MCAATVSRADGAGCPLRVSTSEMKKSEEWLHGGGCGCVCVGKRKSDHVTSLIHPLGLYVCSGTKEWPLRISSAFFRAPLLQPHCSFPVIFLRGLFYFRDLISVGSLEVSLTSLKELVKSYCSFLISLLPPLSLSVCVIH